MRKGFVIGLAMYTNILSNRAKIENQKERRFERRQPFASICDWSHDCQVMSSKYVGFCDHFAWKTNQ